MSTHQKHAKLVKPTGGQYHRFEWTLIGAPCSIIMEWVSFLSSQMKNAQLSCGYLDMVHNAQEWNSEEDIIMEDRINYHNLSSNHSYSTQRVRSFFNESDILFVNGNHYAGDQQIVFVNAKKKDSLQKKLDRLTSVSCFILDEDFDNVHSFLKPFVSDDTPIFSVRDKEKIATHLLHSFQHNIPALFGLVLTGGKSQRMGSDKAALTYHSAPQWKYEADLLETHCTQVYASVSNHARYEVRDYPKIEDTFSGLGPYGGILSAFRYNPNVAWITLACDLPYIDESTIKDLVEARDVNKLATCFYNPETDFPEPLITIWEPRAYPILLEFLSQGYACPRKVLINSNIHMIHMKETFRMKNANTPSEKAAAEKFLSTNES